MSLYLTQHPETPHLENVDPLYVVVEGPIGVGKTTLVHRLREKMNAHLVLEIVEENPLADLKVLYGTGAIRLTEENEVIRAGGVKYTIKDGIVYDAKQLLKDVREMVQKAKEEEGEIVQPGYPNWD